MKELSVKPKYLNGEDWCDRSHLILHAMFQVADDFLQHEANKETWANQDPKFVKAWKRTAKIVEWWNVIGHDELFIYGLTDIQFDARFKWKPRAIAKAQTRSNQRVLARYQYSNRQENLTRRYAKELVDLSRFWWT